MKLLQITVAGSYLVTCEDAVRARKPALISGNKFLVSTTLWIAQLHSSKWPGTSSLTGASRFVTLLFTNSYLRRILFTLGIFWGIFFFFFKTSFSWIVTAIVHSYKSATRSLTPQNLTWCRSSFLKGTAPSPDVMLCVSPLKEKSMYWFVSLEIHSKKFFAKTFWDWSTCWRLYPCNSC